MAISVHFEKRSFVLYAQAELEKRTCATFQFILPVDETARAAT